MHQKLDEEQITLVCREQLKVPGGTTVRTVVAELYRRYGARGRRERVGRILRRVLEEMRAEPVQAQSLELESMRLRLKEAEARAARAEEMERRHQDLWAARFAERVAELEKGRGETRARAGVSSEQYLRLYQRADELWRRLARYEDVGLLLPPLRD